MKFFLLALLLINIGCATNSEPVISNKYFESTNSLFNPYYLDWIYNGSGRRYIQTIKENVININFSSTLGGNTGYIGVCELRRELKDREILINPQIWDSNEEKRKYIIGNLLSACYSLNSDSYPYSEYVLQGM